MSSLPGSSATAVGGASDLKAAALGIARRLEPEVLTGAEAAQVVTDLAIAEKACATARMFAAVRVARTDAWRGQGHASAADWLAAQAGISVAAAHRQLGTARRAQRLPKTREAMRQGRLSPDQADAVSDAATADPASEDDLLGAAGRETTAGLRDKAARAKAAATDDDARRRRIHAERSLRTRTDADGAFHLHLRGPALDGARLTALLRPFQEAAFRDARSSGAGADGHRDTFDNRSYDAFVALLAQLRATGTHAPAPTPHGDGDGDGDGDHPADGARPTPAPAGGNNSKVIVRIDHEALLRGHTVAGETCDIPGLGPIPASAARAMLADAFLAVIVTRGRDVVTVAHAGRGLNAHQRTAIEWTGTRCTNVACNRTVATQIDHRVPYAAHPETKLDNQDPLCPECHRRKTHHGWGLEPGGGRRRFLPPGRAGPP